jgi:hypothetical protein
MNPSLPVILSPSLPVILSEAKNLSGRSRVNSDLIFDMLDLIFDMSAFAWCLGGELRVRPLGVLGGSSSDFGLKISLDK